MKKLILLLPIAAFLFPTFVESENEALYCAKLRDGIIVIVSGEQEITTDIILANGTIIKTDGTLLRTDGTTTILEDRECVDSEGNKIKPDTNYKLDKEETFPKPPRHQ